jgi:hypothetical protein
MDGSGDGFQSLVQVLGRDGSGGRVGDEPQVRMISAQFAQAGGDGRAVGQVGHRDECTRAGVGPQEWTVGVEQDQVVRSGAGSQVGGLLDGGCVGQDDSAVEEAEGDSVGDWVWGCGGGGERADEIVGQAGLVERERATVKDGSEGWHGDGRDGKPPGVGQAVQPAGGRAYPLPPVDGEHPGGDPWPAGERVEGGEGIGGKRKRDKSLEHDDGKVVDG